MYVLYTYIININTHAHTYTSVYLYMYMYMYIYYTGINIMLGDEIRPYFNILIIFGYSVISD